MKIYVYVLQTEILTWVIYGFKKCYSNYLKSVSKKVGNGFPFKT